MARNRRKPAPPTATLEPSQVVPPTTTNTTNGERKIMGLSAEQIQALRQGKTSRGKYLRRLGEFLASGEAGVDVAEEWPADFGESKAAAMKTSFDNAKKHANAPAGAADVDVISNDGHVYLLNSSVA